MFSYAADKSSQLHSAAVGSIVKVTVNKVLENGLLCLLADRSTATVSEAHMKGNVSLYLSLVLSLFFCLSPLYSHFLYPFQQF